MEETRRTVQAPPLVCPHCGGHALAPDAARRGEYLCAQCGTRSRLLTRRHVLLQLGWECAACGHDNERGNRYCTQCGTALAKQCPNCGATMRAGDQFCNACGKSRGQVIAELYRAGRGALDAGRAWEAVLPLQRLYALDPEYGDIPNLLARATREVATQPPPVASPLPSPAARAVRVAVEGAAPGRKVGQRRLFLLAAITVAGLAAVALLAATLLHSATFGVLLFVFLCAIVGVNLWIALNHLP